MTENIEYYMNQIVSARTEIKNLRQRLSALKHEHAKEIKGIKTILNGLRCTDCAAKATTIVNDSHEDQPSTSDSTGLITFQPIGYVETSFGNKRAVPRQPSVLAKSKGIIIINTNVFTNPDHAMSGLEEFSHMWIIFHFHSTESTNVPAKVTPPRLCGERRGVFSTRSPHRPCPIGLSLVKISSIEGNKIHFEGVDMVNGTPVLDIKPYIPHYDCPAPFVDAAMSLVRPPTEGISDAVDGVATLRIGNDDFSVRSLSPRVMNPTGMPSGSHSPYDDETSPDRQSNPTTPISPSPDSHSSVDISETTFQIRSPLRRPETERGAPDGQERFTPPQLAHIHNTSHDGVRVASWISNPPSQTYEVRFTEEALDRLNDLIGERAQSFKSNIESLLSEDPRSVYVRSRYPDHEYSCVLEDLSISCVFDSATSMCTIIAVRNADELQQS
ncbi:unnamed protein product [Parnassius mnemosyne]|uniref:TsaA-like domain-containing protein n=2 Tax=Parnassius mnemosyne TaxID=213953 RepID=A0AAV1L324_9NEOP